MSRQGVNVLDSRGVISFQDSLGVTPNRTSDYRVYALKRIPSLYGRARLSRSPRSLYIEGVLLGKLPTLLEAAA